MTPPREDAGRVTAATITDAQIRELFHADEIAAIELTVATLPGWSAEDRRETRARCAELFNARAQLIKARAPLITDEQLRAEYNVALDAWQLITDEQIRAEYNGDLDVWSVGITLPDGTYVGCGCATEAEVPSAKAQVRARCADLLNARSPA